MISLKGGFSFISGLDENIVKSKHASNLVKYLAS